MPAVLWYMFLLCLAQKSLVMNKDVGVWKQNEFQSLGGKDDKEYFNEVTGYLLFYLESCVLFCVLISQQTVNHPHDENCLSKCQIRL